MPSYETMYSTLFNAITDALHMMEQGKYNDAAVILAAAQCQTEESYIEA